MSVSATVLYPAEADATFDMKYYLSTHMPLVQKHWGPHGLTDWKVIEFQAGPDGSKPYSVQATLTWKDGESLQKALAASETASIFGDVPNFSNKSPVFMAGAVVGSQ